jgi:hypothetical protein
MESETGAGDLQSLCWMGLYFGGFLQSLFAGYIFDNNLLNTPTCFLLAGLVPGARLVLAMYLKEPNKASKMSYAMVQGQVSKFWKTLSHPGIQRPIAFIFLAGATTPWAVLSK